MALSTLGVALEFKAKWPQHRLVSAQPCSLKEALASVERQREPQGPDSSSESLCRGLCLRLSRLATYIWEAAEPTESTWGQEHHLLSFPRNQS